MSHPRQTYIYTALSVAFASIAISSNMVYQKILAITFLGHDFHISAGAVLYPITFLITDIIAEFFGRSFARATVIITIVAQILLACVVKVLAWIDAASWSKVNNDVFNLVFGHVHLSLISSLLACLVSQVFDINIFLLLKKAFKGRYLTARSAFSTGLSLAIDTSSVVGILVLSGVFDASHFFTLVMSSYTYKLTTMILMMPLFTVCASCIKRLSNNSFIT